MLKLLLGYIREISGTWLPKKRVCLAVCVWKKSYEYVDNINNGQVEDIYIYLEDTHVYIYVCTHTYTYPEHQINILNDHLFFFSRATWSRIAQNPLRGKGWKIFQSRKVTLTDSAVWGLPLPCQDLCWWFWLGCTFGDTFYTRYTVGDIARALSLSFWPWAPDYSLSEAFSIPPFLLHSFLETVVSGENFPLTDRSHSLILGGRLGPSCPAATLVLPYSRSPWLHKETHTSCL